MGHMHDSARRHLLAAVLAEAVVMLDDFAAIRTKPKRVGTAGFLQKRDAARAAYGWLMTDEAAPADSHRLSCREVCELLDLDQDFLRQKILQRLGGDSGLK